MADKKLDEVRTGFVTRVNKAVINRVLDDLLQEDVLNDEEVEAVRQQSTVTQDQARRLIDYVRRKGHKASLLAIESIQRHDPSLADHLGLTDFLKASRNPRPGATVPKEETEPVESRKGIKLCPQSLFEKIQKEKHDEIYPIIPETEMRTRLALIICNIEFESHYFSRRAGSEVDMTGMQELLTGLGYQVLCKTNLCSKGMTECLKDFASREEHRTSDSTFVVLLSHSVQAGLCGVKSEETGEGFSDILSLDTIFSILNNKNCPALRDKPKVIIIQACRRESISIVPVSDAAASSADPESSSPRLLEEFESDIPRWFHVEKDFICCWSTTPDNVSWRSRQTGSIFIVQLIRHIQEYAWRCHLEEIFMMVQQELENIHLRMAAKERTILVKRFYLFPGH